MDILSFKSIWSLWLAYTIEGEKIQPVMTQKDLGITISWDLKWESHIINIVKRANSLLYLIRKAFSTITSELFLKLYKTYVRPLLEYSYQVWNPYFRKDIEHLEKVQRRATKLVLTLRNKPYEARLKELRLTTLEERRQRGDLIETYKMLHDYYSVPNLENMYTMNTNKQLRGHSLKLNKAIAASNPRKHFLTNRVVDAWNALPEEVISASSVNSFKNKLDIFHSAKQSQV